MSVITAAPIVRPATLSDDPVRRAIYRSVRTGELSSTGLPDDVIETFCDQQYDVRQRSYAMSLPTAAHSVIEVSREADASSHDTVVGELIVDHGSTSTTIVNIALLESYRGHGIGSSVLRAVLVGADERDVPVGLTVDVGNPARSLYERLGFVTTESSELHYRMRRPALAGATRKDTT